jgi:hypothetical protein
MSDRTPAPASRGRPCSAQREGNVPPATPLNRHTGRVALATSDGSFSPENTNATDPLFASPPAHPAGSRDAGWRPPPWGSGEGELRSPIGEALSATEGSAILRSYSESKCSSQTPIAERPAWLATVGALTRPFRAAQAMRHRGRARYMRDCARHSVADYHLVRAEGQMLRMANVADCGEREVLFSCGDCGHNLRKAVARCGHHRLCLVCRGQRARRYRLRIRIARQRMLDEVARVRRSRGRQIDWQERFLTLTIPHSGNVVRDLKTLPRAWKLFRRWLWLFFADEHRLDKELLKLVAFVRVTEVTAGRSNEGHAHYHVYLYCPYVPHELARHLWGKALKQLGYTVPTRAVEAVIAEARTPFAAQQLRRAFVTRKGPKGRPLAETEWPVLDLKQAYGNVETELVKYLVKDVVVEDGSAGLIAPALYARIYEGLEGLRTIATSRKFFQEQPKDCFCEHCGSSRLRRVVAAPEASSPSVPPTPSDAAGPEP